MTTAIDHAAVLRASEKFQQWNRVKPPLELGHLKMMAERHYTPNQLATLWGVDAETIRNIFRNEAGVLKLQKDNAKRAYVTLRIPESVAEKVHRRLSA
jgi:hypothetical protein